MYCLIKGYAVSEAPLVSVCRAEQSCGFHFCVLWLDLDIPAASGQCLLNGSRVCMKRNCDVQGSADRVCTGESG